MEPVRVSSPFPLLTPEQVEALIHQYTERQTQLDRDRMRIKAFFREPSIEYATRERLFLQIPDVLHSIDQWKFTPPRYRKKYGEIVWEEAPYFLGRGEIFLVLERGEWEEDAEKSGLLLRDFVEAGIFGFRYDW